MNAGRLLLYKVDKDTADVISAKYGTRFEILDVSDCFMDLMVLQARAILIDPDELYDQEIDLLADVFAGETEKEVYFTSQPAYPELLKDVTWKLFPYTQKKEAKPVAARKYSNRRIEEMLEEAKQSGDRFYVNGILNYKGKSAEGDYYTKLNAVIQLVAVVGRFVGTGHFPCSGSNADGSEFHSGFLLSVLYFMPSVTTGQKIPYARISCVLKPCRAYFCGFVLYRFFCHVRHKQAEMLVFIAFFL